MLIQKNLYITLTSDLLFNFAKEFDMFSYQAVRDRFSKFILLYWCSIQIIPSMVYINPWLMPQVFNTSKIILANLPTLYNVMNMITALQVDITKTLIINFK